MKLERRGDPAAQPEQKSTSPGGGKPVIVYIMILFIAAFLLMALSFLMHQRSNSQAMGQLETSFHATMEEIQETQLELVELERQLAETRNDLEAAETLLGQREVELTDAQAQLEAQQILYAIQQTFSAGDYPGCQALIDEAEQKGLVDFLPSTPLETAEGVVTAPFVRFQQFKYAVSQKLED